MDDTLILLGVPRRLGAGEPVFLTRGLATQMAAVLALRGDWVGRDELVTLLWPDFDLRRGRHNLSQLLHIVRRSPWGHDIETGSTRLRWSIQSDVGAFRRAIADGDWQRAADFDASSLLEGTAGGTSGPFDAWLRAERADLHDAWREALLSRATALAADGRWPEAARVLRRVLANDDLLEGAVQGLIRAEARSGRRDAALLAFEAFRNRLADELSLEPLAATTALAMAVRRGDLEPDALDLQRSLGDREGEAHLEVNLGIHAQHANALDEAAERYGRALRIRYALGARALVPQSVSCFLDLAVAQGDLARALVLAGAVRSLCEAVGVSLTPPQQATYDAALATARAAMPVAAAADLEQRGASLGEREAVAFALGERTTF